MNKKLYRNDIILSACVVILALSVYVFMMVAPKTKNDMVSVETNGEHVMDISLSDDGEYMVADTGIMLKIENGIMTVLHTDCKDLVCTQMRIDGDGGSIICLPNKTVIRPIVRNDELDVKAG